MASPDQRDDSGRTVTLAGEEETTDVRRLALLVVEGPARGRATNWAGVERIAVGAHEGCDLVLDDPTASRFHCEIRMDGRGASIRDMGSRNGTFVDGVQIKEAYLRSGSQVGIGRSVVRVDLGLQTDRVPMSESARFGRMVGTSVAMRRTFAAMERAAGSNATVVLEGETGVGKTLAARSIHEQSARQAGPFILLDCAALPPTLLESELFGHEKGAFTGAETRRLGAFEQASGGTLFLDEVGELPLDLQSKLLGVLENREIRRLGAGRPVSVDVRVIAATHRNLRQEVNAGRFRADLYYRLAVVAVVQPPLRERSADIPAIARQMLENLGAGAEQIERLMSAAFIERISRALWPGNLRELRNYLERCLVFDEPQPFDMPIALDPAEPSPDLPYVEARERALRGFERRYLRALLDVHDSVSAAAERAGIDRTYFYRLLRRHGMTR